MEANNLNELNKILFDTLRGVKDGSVDDKKAQTITNVSNSIINNAKMQLSAYKLTKGKAYNDVFEQPTGDLLESGNLYELKHEYAIKKGYKSVSEAYDGIGKGKFETMFSQWVQKK